MCIHSVCEPHLLWKFGIKRCNTIISDFDEGRLQMVSTVAMNTLRLQFETTILLVNICCRPDYNKGCFLRPEFIPTSISITIHAYNEHTCWGKLERVLSTTVC